MHTRAEIVAIIDDDPDAAASIAFDIEDAGYKVVFAERQANLKKMVAWVTANATVALCDNRLRHGAFANYFGAELAQELVKKSFPAIVITQFLDVDAEVQIRSLRRDLPVVMRRVDLDRESFKKAVSLCYSEIRGDAPSNRRPHRAIVEIQNISKQDGQVVVDAFIRTWKPRESVRFPISMMPKRLQKSIAIEKKYLADVNTGAQSGDEVFLSNFSLAPPPTDDVKI